MSDVRSLRERFLARVEQVRVRIPLDSEAVADLSAAQEQRARMVTAYERARADYEEGKSRKLSTPAPVEPDYSEVEQWIADADRRVDENSLVVVLQWVPKVYAAITREALDQKHTQLQMAYKIAEAYYLRTEALDGDEWVDQDFTWDQIVDRLSEGEVTELGSHGTMLANASDAAPFVKRSTNSKPG